MSLSNPPSMPPTPMNDTPTGLDIDEILSDYASYFPWEPGTLKKSVYEQATNEAKQALIRWGLEQRKDELRGVRGWTDYDSDPKYCSQERFHAVPYSYLHNRISEIDAELQANLQGEQS